MKRLSPYHEKYNKFYSSKEWKAFRDFIRQRDKVCVECKEKGVISQGYEVHHRKPIEEHPELAYDEDNCRLLCKQCHDEKHDRVSDLAKFILNRK